MPMVAPISETFDPSRMMPFLNRAISHAYEGQLVLADASTSKFRPLHRYRAQEVSTQYELPLIQERRKRSASCGYVRIESGNTNEGRYESLNLRTNRPLKLQRQGNLPPFDILISVEFPEYEDPLQVREDSIRFCYIWHAHDLSSVLPTKLFLQKHITSLDKVRGSEE